MGETSEGIKLKSVEELWDVELGKNGEKRIDWYGKATEYWNNQETSVNGVLGGYEHVSSPDLRDSHLLLDRAKLLSENTGGPLNFSRALDCGAGIGRVTKGLLVERFAEVDIVEPCVKYCEAARDYVNHPNLNEIFCDGLQNFIPKENYYDCIWIQWVLLYLPDPDLIAFIQRCRKALRPGGVICCKENVVINGGFHVDKDDNSIMRTALHYRELLEKAGCTVHIVSRQRDFPDELFPVMMYLCR